MKRDKKIFVAWWSGGATSAVACKKTLEIFPLDTIRIIFIDTANESDDTYRFKKDCEKWYGQKIETITAIGDKYKTINDVWDKYQSLNVASGAVCSSELKRRVRQKWQKNNKYDAQVFGFEFTKREFNRSLSLNLNHPDTKAIYPLLFLGLEKSDCLSLLKKAKVKIPEAYTQGFSNNNCLKTGCVQGGFGYWQKYKKDFPKRFDDMAAREHCYSKSKGRPVTILRQQIKGLKSPVFLKHCVDFPDVRNLSQMKKLKVKPLLECNGFCGGEDLVASKDRNQTEFEINREETY